jgi:hypothetical protein
MKFFRMITTAVITMAMSVTAFASTVNEYYEVHHTDGRVYAFGESRTYHEWQERKELVYSLARIAKGPGGKTLIFGMSKDDSKKDVNTLPYVLLYEGKAEGAKEGFYGEIIKEGRFYVFTSWDAMKDFRQSGEAPYMVTRVAWGPGRSTVAFVQTKAESKSVPTTAIERFQQAYKF